MDCEDELVETGHECRMRRKAYMYCSLYQASLQDHVPATILPLDIWEDTKPTDDCRNGLLAKTELGCSGECAKL